MARAGGEGGKRRDKEAVVRDACLLAADPEQQGANCSKGETRLRAKKWRGGAPAGEFEALVWRR